MIVVNERYAEASPFSKYEISMIRQGIAELDEYLQETPGRRRRVSDFPRYSAVLRDALVELVDESHEDRLTRLIQRQQRRILQADTFAEHARNVQLDRYQTLLRAYEKAIT